MYITVAWVQQLSFPLSASTWTKRKITFYLGIVTGIKTIDLKCMLQIGLVSADCTLSPFVALQCLSSKLHTYSRIWPHCLIPCLTSDLRTCADVLPTLIWCSLTITCWVDIWIRSVHPATDGGKFLKGNSVLLSLRLGKKLFLCVW